MKGILKAIGCCLLILLATTCIASCTGSDDDSKQDKVVSVKIEIQPEACAVYGLFDDQRTSPLPGMTMKEEGWSQWENHEQTTISGFTFEEGYCYQLLVRKTILANPPADGSAWTYQLIEVLSKTKAASDSTGK